ncbi:MAG TPA: xanthine dehydrogenase family protein subunit M [Burkholderiales bacterium]
MKAPRFAYARPSSVAETLALLAQHKGDARVLAGGQSLVPMLNFRVAAPAVLVDINRVAGLSGIDVAKDRVRIGAMTRHTEIERSPAIARHLPLLAEAIAHVAHPAVRNRGTFGGSCALADPAAELPACALALGGTFVVAGPRGERRVPAAEFFTGLYATALDPRELLVAAEFPLPAPGAVSAFGELARRHGDYALVGVAAHALARGGALHDARVVFFGVGDKPVRAARIERALEGRAADARAIAGALEQLDADLAPRADLHASAPTKRHLAKVLAGRVLARLPGAAA